MKRIAIVGLLLLVAAFAVGQEPIYYNTTPTLTWTPATFDPNSEAFLPGDTVEYRVYKWDIAVFGFDPAPPITSMELVATWIDTDPNAADANGEEQLQITLLPRLQYGVALAATHIDGGGNRTDYSYYLVSSRPGDVAYIPFAYIPVAGAGTESPGQGLRDSGT